MKQNLQCIVYSPLIRKDFFSTFYYLKSWFSFWTRSEARGPLVVHASIARLGSEGISARFFRFHSFFHRAIKNSRGDFVWLPDLPITQVPDCCCRLLLHQRVLIGPNVDVHQLRSSLSIKEDLHILAPSSWVVDFLQEVLALDKERIATWPSCIDLVFWTPNVKGTDDFARNEVLIYVKVQPDAEEIQSIYDYCSEFGLEPRFIEYGEYTAFEFRQRISQCLFVVILGGTESQGLAILECWAMNRPTLVRRAPIFQFGERVFVASSAPYLTDQTGQFTVGKHLSYQDLLTFHHRLNEFAPRDWVMNNLTSKESAAPIKAIVG